MFPSLCLNRLVFMCLLKVEQLFRLGLRSRAECEELLQYCQWNLEESSKLMLDTYPTKTCKYNQTVHTFAESGIEHAAIFQHSTTTLELHP